MIDTGKLIQQLPYPGLFISLILGSVGLPLPEEATLILCGYLISQATIQAVPGICVVYTGVLASDFIVFSLGRRYGRRLLQHKFFHRLLSPDRLLCLEDRFLKIAPFLIIFGRHLFGLRTKIIFMSSLMGMPPRRFLLLDSIAAIISVSVMVFIGYSGGNLINTSMFESLSPAYPFLLVTAALVSAVLVFRHFVFRRKKCPAKKAYTANSPDPSAIEP